MIYRYKDYRNYLRDVYRLRKKKNPAYSMNAFALALTLPKSTLVSILQKTRNLPEKMTPVVAGALRLSEPKTQYLRLLVEKERTKSPARKKELLKQIHSQMTLSQRLKLQTEKTSILEKWFVLSLLELCNVTGFQLNATRGASALGISELEAELAITQLLEIGALKKNADGFFEKTGSGILVSSPALDFNLRNFHLEMLEKTKKSLVSQEPTERFIGSETFGFNVEQLAMASEAIEECFTKVVSIANQADTRKSIYHLGIQMFRLSETIDKGYRK